MNSVNIIGNITRNLELKQTNSGKSVLNFNIAVNSGYGDKATTEFIDVVVWEKQAENVAKYCGKGSKVAVSGSLKTDTYERKDGSKGKSYTISAHSVEFLTTKNSSESQSSESSFTKETKEDEWDYNDFGVKTEADLSDDEPF